MENLANFPAVKLAKFSVLKPVGYNHISATGTKRKYANTTTSKMVAPLRPMACVVAAISWGVSGGFQKHGTHRLLGVELLEDRKWPEQTN